MPVTQLPRALSALTLVASILALTACTAPDPTPPTSSSPPPVFANEEEALAAVTAKLDAFILAVNTIGATGEDLEQLDEVFTPELSEAESEGFAEMSSNGWHTTGEASLKRVELVHWWDRPDAVHVVAVVRACIDYTGVDVLDATGASVVRPGRDELRATEMQLVSENEALLISSKNPISESDICA
ncbi:hypothetical protein ITJ57_04340 [Plantibacter sp. VKM Ac-2880]|uniref:hypothetical protein n=1 Tax=Plantibacter sp. VKM Ac-2880 TaxID=2783827 RepID=UPI00189085FE|nr:hypothetical protein [Plantibacter sp. VKM Ac-2880]MBF4567991.1 hypothetical protein [Plantibacter sp. VKM Ac-2880]